MCPRRDQERLSGETIEKPLSSSKINVAANSRHFFYPWPNIPLPLLHFIIIALDGHSLCFLTAPAQALHYVPHTTRCTPHSVQLPDDMPDPFQRPIIFPIPMSIRPALQLFFQCFHLLRRQFRRLAWAAFTLFSGLLGFLSPSTHCAFTHPMRLGDHSHRFSFFQFFQRSCSSLVQSFACAFRSHTSYYDTIYGFLFLKTQ